MRKLYTAILCLLSVVTVSAQHQFINVKSARQISERTGSVLKAEAADNNLTTMAVGDGIDFENESQWVDLGECAYSDDIVTTCWSVGVQTYNVRVQKDVANEGVYRIVNPWENYPASARRDVENHEDYPGILPIGDEYTILIDARNPEKVRIPESRIGLENSRGEYTVCSISELLGQGYYGVTESTVEAAYGKLVDGVITFPQRHALYLLTPDRDWWLGNKFGGFQLVLTGTTLPIDYDFMIQCKQAFCADSNGSYQFLIDADENIPQMYCKVISSWPEEDVSILDVMNNGRVCYPGQTVTVPESVFTDRCMYFMVVACDADGNFQSARYIDMYASDFAPKEWAPLGKADMTEGFLSCLFPTLFDAETFEVDVEYNVKKPDYYRVVNPYDSWKPAEGYLTYGHSHNHYIYINAAEPDKVYIEVSPLGLELLHYGEAALCCDYGMLLLEWGQDFLELMGINESGGHIKDNVITFDERAGIYLYLSNAGYYMTNCFVNPDYDENAASANPETYPVRPYLPGKFKLDLNKAFGGVGNISIDNERADAEYFNLQGVKIENPGTGLYIRRQGTKTEKVMLR